MGRHYYSTKTEADCLKKISISFLNKNGFFETALCSKAVSWWRNGEKTGSITVEYRIDDFYPYLKFIYTQTDNDTGKKEDFDYKVHLTSTPCYFGGLRYWFICPLTVNGKPCGRRVGTLYKNGNYFGCRHCYDLTYSSKNESRSLKRYPAFDILNLYQKIEDLEDKIKHPYYAKRPTKKQRKLEKIYQKILNLSHLI